MNRREGYFVAVFLVLVVALAIVYVRFRRPALSVQRKLRPSVVAVGETFEATAALESKVPSVGVAAWREQVPPAFGDGPQGGMPAFERFHGRFRARLDYALRPNRRGIFTLGPLWLSQQDPFGLVDAERAVGERAAVTVTPRVTALARSGLIGASGEGARHELHQLTNPRADELIAREYRPGDPMRRVHWRATARRGELMVRQEEQQGDPEACLLLDTSGGVSHDGFEMLVELTASLGSHLMGEGYRLALVETVTDVSLGTAADGEPTARHRVTHFGHGEVTAFLGALAEVEQYGRSENFDVTSGLRPLLSRAGQAAPVFCVLAALAAVDARRLAAVKRHADPAVAWVVDPVRPGTAEKVLSDALVTLRDSGWRAVRSRPDDDVTSAWARVAFGDDRHAASATVRGNRVAS